MVCLGNICRSPVAEGILRHKAQVHGLDIEVDSVGTGNWHVGQAPDIRSQKVAKSNGIDISSLRGRHVSKADFSNFDLILAMDNANYKDLLKLASTPAEQAKVKLILDYAYPNQQLDVPDPYFGSESGFDSMFVLLDEAIEKLVEELKG